MNVDRALLQNAISYRRSVTATSGRVAIPATSGFDTIEIYNPTSFVLFAASGDASIVAVSNNSAAGSSAIYPGASGTFALPHGAAYVAFVFEAGGSGTIHYQYAIIT